MAERRTGTRGTATRKTKEGTRRRVTKSDGRLADFSSLRTATGVVIPEVRKVLLDRQKEHKEAVARRQGIMYPSEMCKTDWCPRSTYFRMTGAEDKQSRPSMTLESIFAEGHAIHDKWQNWLSDTGKMWGDWRCTRCSEYVKNSLKPADTYGGSCVGVGWVKEGTSHFSRDMISAATEAFPHDWKYKEITLKTDVLPISGHADGGLVPDNILIEIKSISLGGMRYDAPKLIESATYEIQGRKITDVDRMWKDFHHPLSAHLRQANLYLWMCEQMGLPFDRISFIYEFKSNQQAKEFLVPYSYDLVEPMLDKARMVILGLGKQIPPDCIRGSDGCPQCKVYEKEG